ncbi:hypothetical protein [Polyangium sp. 15x6]|uniref:hypothetical protein n=1 Tax=Polyangium sp. 15x6 TaxID=3042687 RepID=UPI00249BF3A2|nr:hypothetical protein [Polyangium sp. 15x6]MDI3285322.1 hypothetical protein [Polyangium sp. 15x6]
MNIRFASVFGGMLPRALGPAGVLASAVLAACGSPDVDNPKPDAADAGITGDLSPSDVSILWPAPENGELPPGYLKIFPAAGERGPGLPSAARDVMPDLHADLPGGAKTTLTVIAARVDPCAPRASGPCVHELRLSAETLAVGLDDAALHLIYELDDARFAALASDLTTWRAHSPASTSGRLRVHPGLAAAGIGSAFAEELHDIIVRYATEESLISFTTNHFAFDNWGFSRFVRNGAVFEKVDLPGLPAGTLSQSWLRQAQQDDLDDPNGTLTPAPAKNFGALLKTDALVAGTSTPEVLAARDAVLENEHPGKTNSAKNDCGSCHLADAAHRWAEKRGVVFDTLEKYLPPAGVDVTVDVPPELMGNASNTVAFGYHRVRHEKLVPSISARVAAETAEVVKRLREP